ncbi:MAG: sugar ABC transporter substrate-binding protein [Anaerolineae bacterium]|nr:sugar ABC transporter substrate-binding protein [Anaerolineae bacterium]
MSGQFSRRDFLKQAALAAGATAASGLTGSVVALAQPLGQDTIPLRAMTIGGPERAATFEAVVGAFREAHPNWDLQWVPVAGTEWDTFLARVATVLASGQQLDNVEIGTEGFLTFATSGITRKLDDYVNANQDEMKAFFGDVSPKLIEAVMYQGSLYNLPSLWAAAGIYYNKRLFDQAGLEYPAEDWTVEQFADAARAIRALGDDIYGYGMPNRHWGGFVPWSFIRDSNILVMEQAEGGEWLWDNYYPDMTPEERAQHGGGYWYTASSANDPKNVEALQFLQDLTWKDDAMYVAELGNLQAAFATGKLGMMVSHRAFIANFTRSGLPPEDYDVVYMPMWDSQKGQFGGSGLALTTLSQYPEEAWELLKYMTSADVQSAYIYGGIHTASRRSVTNDPAQNDGIAPGNWHVYYDQLDEKPAYPIPAPPQNRDFTTIFTRYMGLAMANEMPAQDALDNMHAELNRMLGVAS